MNKEQKICEQTLIINEPKKHSVRYDSNEADPPLRTVYISKRAFGIQSSYPKEINILVTSKLDDNTEK